MNLSIVSDFIREHKVHIAFILFLFLYNTVFKDVQCIFYFDIAVNYVRDATKSLRKIYESSKYNKMLSTNLAVWLWNCLHIYNIKIANKFYDNWTFASPDYPFDPTSLKAYVGDGYNLNICYNEYKT